MSHWYRSPRAISVRELLIRGKQKFILDQMISVELKRYLTRDANMFWDFHLTENSSPQEIIKSCQRKHGVLVTANPGYIYILSSEAKVPWGVFLLPDAETAQIDVLRRLSSSKLVFRPSEERMDDGIYPARPATSGSAQRSSCHQRVLELSLVTGFHVNQRIH